MLEHHATITRVDQPASRGRAPQFGRQSIGSVEKPEIHRIVAAVIALGGMTNAPLTLENYKHVGEIVGI